ncbi:helix-turn-helix transcriptional regulator [Streptomyces tremellae]|uniref:Helix-turn-helix transcriptional regulator n=1 Tax=Streptomyces tremellae TaxID=1124239 RepID=A0ABP7ETD8_9ACTN
MPSRTLPAASVRQRRLGSELRRLRRSAGLTAGQAGALDGSSQPRISSIESGRYGVSAERVRALARIYGCLDEAYVEALAEMTGGRTRGWWDAYRDLVAPDALDLAELEHHAPAMRTASAVHLPGLLQTRAHAYAVISDAVPPLAPYEVEHRVSFRIKRQAVLYGAASARLTAIVHETALRLDLGGPAVAREQLRFLLDMGARDNVTVRVLPFGTGTSPGAGGNICYLSGAVPALDTVQLDAEHGSMLLDSPAHLAGYRTVLDRLEARSLDEAASRELIRRIAARL